jgi:uncharacterized protein with FMN-binding domain
MKKYLLSTIVILSFLIYSYIVRKNISNQAVPKIILNPNSEANKTNTTTIIPSVSGGFKDGTYTGDSTDAFYGTIQIAAVIQNGKLTKVNILRYPNDRNRSITINTNALPILQSEAIQNQTANVDIVSGATDTSQAFITSLGSALLTAKN